MMFNYLCSKDCTCLGNYKSKSLFCKIFHPSYVQVIAACILLSPIVSSPLLPTSGGYAGLENGGRAVPSGETLQAALEEKHLLPKPGLRLQPVEGHSISNNKVKSCVQKFSRTALSSHIRGNNKKGKRLKKSPIIL